MMLLTKNKILSIIIWFLAVISIVSPMVNSVDAVAPQYEKDFSSMLTKDKWVYDPGDFASGGVGAKKTLRENISGMFYPRSWNNSSVIYTVIKDITLWIMIIFFVRAWASLLLNKKPEEARKHLYSLLYIILWWVFVYGANWLFWEVFHFNEQFTSMDTWIKGFTDTLIWRVLFLVLSAIKAAAFFLAIIMTVITWFRVMAAGEWEKWKKLVKWLINVVVALLVIKWIDFIYYIAADSSNFIDNASNLIINVAKVFGRIYGVITVIMVIVAWYLYITDGWTWSNFKKASNVLINVLLSALVLFGFLLIVYQIFAEFQTWWDAVTPPEGSTTFLIVDNFYV